MVTYAGAGIAGTEHKFTTALRLNGRGNTAEAYAIFAPGGAKALDHIILDKEIHVPENPFGYSMSGALCSGFDSDYAIHSSR